MVTALTLALAAAPGSASATAHAQPAPVKEFTVVARPTEMRLASGQPAPAWGYNGQVPGPEIRVTEGTSLSVPVGQHGGGPAAVPSGGQSAGH